MQIELKIFLFFNYYNIMSAAKSSILKDADDTAMEMADTISKATSEPLKTSLSLGKKIIDGVSKVIQSPNEAKDDILSDIKKATEKGSEIAKRSASALVEQGDEIMEGAKKLTEKPKFMPTTPETPPPADLSEKPKFMPTTPDTSLSDDEESDDESIGLLGSVESKGQDTDDEEGEDEEDEEDEDEEGEGEGEEDEDEDEEVEEDEEDESDDDEDEDYDPSQYKKLEDYEYNDKIIENHGILKVPNYKEVSSLCNILRDKNGIIRDDFHKTIPIATKYEITNVLSARAVQLNNGAFPYIPIEGVLDGYTIAKKELQQKKIPFIVRRPLPNGESEYWRLADLDTNLHF